MGIIQKPFRPLPKNPKTSLQRFMLIGLKPHMTELRRHWKKPKTT
jgi:hypothetical protein